MTVPTLPRPIMLVLWPACRKGHRQDKLAIQNRTIRRKPRPSPLVITESCGVVSLEIGLLSKIRQYKNRRIDETFEDVPAAVHVDAVPPNSARRSM